MHTFLQTKQITENKFMGVSFLFERTTSSKLTIVHVYTYRERNDN